jgi:hypothetical protein
MADRLWLSQAQAQPGIGLEATIDLLNVTAINQRRSTCLAPAIDFRRHGSQVCKPIGSNQGLFEVVPVQGHGQFRSVEKDPKAIAVATDAHDDALFLGNSRTADGAEWA